MHLSSDLAIKKFQFVMTVWTNNRASFKNWRNGQALFNALKFTYPKIADEIRGDTTIDPFYKDENIPKTLSFVAKKLGIDD